MRSGRSDDEAMSPQMRQIVATAAMSGIEPTGGAFSQNAFITKGEAAAMLNAALGLYDVVLPEEAAENTLQACMNLRSAGIVSDDYPAAETLSREEAARMLIRAMEKYKK